MGEVKALATTFRRMNPDRGNYASLRKGTLVSIQAGTPDTYTITLSGNAEEISGVYALDSYNPTVGDTVILGKQGGSLLILGRIGDYTGGGTTYVYNVKDYGATGLGSSTDDTAGFQAAIDAASTFASTSGVQATVLVPPDTYRVDGLTVLKDNITLYCEGAIIKSHVYTTTLFSTTGGSADNLHVIGGTFDAQGHLAATDASYNIFTIGGAAQNVKFENCTFRNVSGWHAIDISEGNNIHITNCRFEGYVDNTSGGTRGFSEAIQLDADDSTGNTTNNVYVSGCYSGPSANCSAWPKLVGSHTNTVGDYYENIQIIGNRIESATDVAIQGYSWRDAVIANNVILDPTVDGIKLTQTVNNTASRISVTGNVIDNPGGRGIWFDGNTSQVFQNCTIADNTIYSAASAGIEVQFFNSGSITDNQIHDGASHGILSDTSKDVQMSGNNVVNVDLNGIHLATNERTSVEGNKVSDPGQRGIYISTSSLRTVVIGNTVNGASRSASATYGGISISGSANNDSCIMANRIGSTGPAGSANIAVRPINFEANNSTGVQIANNSFYGFTEKGVETAVHDSSINTTSTTYANLSTTVSVSAVTGTAARVDFAATMGSNSADGIAGFTSVAVSGATTIAASDNWAIRVDEDSVQYNKGSMSHLFTGLTPGLNTFTLQSKAGSAPGGTGIAVNNREIIVTPVAL